MAKATQRQIVATIEPTEAGTVPNLSGGGGDEGYFTTVSGGEISAAVEKIYDGGRIHPEVLVLLLRLTLLLVGMLQMIKMITVSFSSYGS